jgi:hypothetical protein
MCKRRQHTPMARLAAGQAYEGRTVLLDTPHDRPAAHRCRRFPWWTLWLLWPLLVGLKWLIPLWVNLVSTAAGAVSSAGGAIAASVLIAAGLILIWRSETTKDEHNA